MCTIRSNQCIIRMPSTNTDSRNILPIRNRPIWNQKECSYRRRKSKTTKIWKATRHLSIKLREQDLQSRRSIVHSAVELKYLPDPSQTRNMEHWNGINLSSSSRLVKIYSGTFEISLIDWERGVTGTRVKWDLNYKEDDKCEHGEQQTDVWRQKEE